MGEVQIMTEKLLNLPFYKAVLDWNKIEDILKNTSKLRKILEVIKLKHSDVSLLEIKHKDQIKIPFVYEFKSKIMISEIREVANEYDGFNYLVANKIANCENQIFDGLDKQPTGGFMFLDFYSVMDYPIDLCVIIHGKFGLHLNYEEEWLECPA